MVEVNIDMKPKLITKDIPGSGIYFRDDILKLFTLYLEKVDKLNDEERQQYVDYFKSLSTPIFNEDMFIRDFKNNEPD